MLQISFDETKLCKLADITKWQKFYRVKMPNDLVIISLTIGGSEIFGDNRNYQMLGPIDSIGYYKAYHFAKFMPDGIPICMDGGGNFCVYKRIKKMLDGIYVVDSGALFWDHAKYVGKNISDMLNHADSPSDILSAT